MWPTKRNVPYLSGEAVCSADSTTPSRILDYQVLGESEWVTVSSLGSIPVDGTHSRVVSASILQMQGRQSDRRKLFAILISSTNSLAFHEGEVNTTTQNVVLGTVNA